jgi:hypothetical protein
VPGPPGYGVHRHGREAHAFGSPVGIFGAWASQREFPVMMMMMMMMTFITLRGEGQGNTKKERKATKSRGRGLEEGARRALMR